jgi:hypothetical protein
MRRDPYVGEGVDGALRSATIDRDELDTLDLGDPRRATLLDSIARWERQAKEVADDAMREHLHDLGDPLAEAAKGGWEER